MNQLVRRVPGQFLPVIQDPQVAKNVYYNLSKSYYSLNE